MHLWQIRHIPNLRQTLLKLTAAATPLFFVGVYLCQQTSSISGQTTEPATTAATPGPKSAAATEFFEKVRQGLPNHRSIKADIVQTVSMGDQQVKVTGEYLSSGQKLRLKYVVNPDQGIQGEVLEVCDGKELWTLLSLPDVKRVTHRNVEQILASANEKKTTTAVTNLELGLGGLSALFASLSRTMDFDAMKEEDGAESPKTIIQGRWKAEFLERVPKEKIEQEEVLPPYVPELIRIYVNPSTLFPERIVYLKKQQRKKSFKPLVTLDFQNIEFDGQVEDDAFVFTPPDGVIPEDTTAQYLGH